MKVRIGPYKNWIGPYQISQKIFFWLKFHGSLKDEQHERWDYRACDKLGDWLADTWVNDFCVWIDKKRTRLIDVKIDKYDTWNMDETLAHIIHPMLVQLKKDKNGAPWVDDEDVPEHLRSTAAPPKENEWDTDELFFDRWEYVLDEMIFAFDAIRGDWEEKFYSGNIDIAWEKQENGLSKMINGPNNTFKVDAEGRRNFHDRMQNGFRLFGKYYQNLWD